MGKAVVDISGEVFGRLTAIKKIGSQNGHALWECICSCGNLHKAILGNLRYGFVSSCGCFNKETHTTHGLARTPEYRVWQDMKDRCSNKKNNYYKDYGGRGIRVCLRWQESFEEFYKSVGPKPFLKAELDRINNNKGYYPNNVRWTTSKENSRNTRRNRLITYKGETKCVSEWAEITGISKGAIKHRLNVGWDISEVLEKPSIRPRI
jgi:hypothetical protein